MGSTYGFIGRWTNDALFQAERELAEQLGKMAHGSPGCDRLWAFRFAVRRELYKRRAVTKHWLNGLC